jgi:phosphogluconate dehydratase
MLVRNGVVTRLALPPRDLSRPVREEIATVTERIRSRSGSTRAAYLAMLDDVVQATHPRRTGLGCANQAHAFAACDASTKLELRLSRNPQLAIVTAYNDMLSAHQPFADYPSLIKQAARDVGALAQVAGGVPAMCDGITQGHPGMELSLLSREVVAMSTAIALAHDVFDGALLLGVCDKIVPGLLIGALQFGHLPVALVPAGPMPSGLPNAEKKRVRKLHAEGRVAAEALMEAEAASYHSAGTCTFYGTANSNQLVVEVMGLHLPGSAFIPPGTPLRDALTRASAQRVAELTALGPDWLPLGRAVDERSIVNAVVALLATGGSTNHTMHLVAIAAAAGIDLRWEDIDALSATVPLLARMYPNGAADVNEFHAAGGTAALIGELLDAGLLHEDVPTLAGPGLSRYRRRPELDAAGALTWSREPAKPGDPQVLRRGDEPFQPDGGLRVLDGSLGRSVMKVSAVAQRHRVTEAPARVFEDQASFSEAFARGELDHDVVVVVRFQGPKANGMPELHKLVPALSVLLDRGRQVALVTDGRMSGASGAVPAAIHVTPEAYDGGPLARIVDGDIVRVDADQRRLDVLVDREIFESRPDAPPPAPERSLARGMFARLRAVVGAADRGASIFPPLDRDEAAEFLELAELSW